MNDLFSRPELLAVLEVDKSDRVVCQAPGCGHAVYKRIHVVREGGFASVYGSDCFVKLFGDVIADAKPRYGDSEGRLLSAEERAMLKANTERLLAQFESERTSELERQRFRQEQQRSLESAAADRAEKAKRDAELRQPPSQQQIASVEMEAKRIVREKYQVDPDQAGWRGLVMAEAEKLLRKR